MIEKDDAELKDMMKKLMEEVKELKKARSSEQVKPKAVYPCPVPACGKVFDKQWGLLCHAFEEHRDWIMITKPREEVEADAVVESKWRGVLPKVDWFTVALVFIVIALVSVGLLAVIL